MMRNEKGRRTITCEEWEPIPVGVPGAQLSFEDLGNIFSRWRTQTGTDPSNYFDLRGNTLIPRNWSGVAPGDDVQLEVLPIGSAGLLPAQRAVLDGNISLMLQASLTGGSMELGEGEVSRAGQRVEALLLAFCRLLAKARRRQVIRRYSPERMSTRCTRGRTVFPAQVFESIRRPGYFVSEWVALNEDTPENRVLKAVLGRSRARVSGSLRYKLDELLCEFENVSLVSSPESEWRRIRFDRLSRDYSILLKLGKSLLDGEAPGFFSGLASATTEIVFTARVYESFVASQLGRIAVAHGYRAEFQPRGRYFGQWRDGRHSGRSSFELIPDIQLYRDGNNSVSCVIDTKWKRLIPASTRYGINLDDIYQIVTYAVRFGHTHGILAYPWIGGGNPFGGTANYISIPMVDNGTKIKVLITFIPMLDNGFANWQRQAAALLENLSRE
jgi:5-methylcytosine-specific restriction enzyme subunit McrC